MEKLYCLWLKCGTPRNAQTLRILVSFVVLAMGILSPGAGGGGGGGGEVSV